jgi:hypothetical protein
MDTSVCTNVILTSTLKAIGNPKEKIIPRPIMVYGIGA